MERSEVSAGRDMTPIAGRPQPLGQGDELPRPGRENHRKPHDLRPGGDDVGDHGRDLVRGVKIEDLGPVSRSLDGGVKVAEREILLQFRSHQSDFHDGAPFSRWTST